MLKPKQALEIIRSRVKLHISLETLYNWIKKGKLKVKRLGGMVLIDPSDLDIFLADFAATDKQYVGRVAE
ncbi:MAG: DNA-binding protein [Erysipelotrichia bacterium]|nr:DNA-binding protein [Erysipelotrichia bacterium]